MAAKKKLNRNWLNRHLDDPYVKKAQQQGFRARAAFKLAEIDLKEKLIHPNMSIIDLGAAPGSWSQYVSRKLQLGGTPRTNDSAPSTPSSLLIAVDILAMDPVDGVFFLQADFREENTILAIQERLRQSNHNGFDLVLSDMAPNLSGIAAADSARMSLLHELILEFALTHLLPQGKILLKAFHGSGFSQSIEMFKKHFNRVVIIKPNASRSESSETFILCTNPKSTISVLSSSHENNMVD